MVFMVYDIIAMAPTASDRTLQRLGKWKVPDRDSSRRRLNNTTPEDLHMFIAIAERLGVLMGL